MRVFMTMIVIVAVAMANKLLIQDEVVDAIVVAVVVLLVHAAVEVLSAISLDWQVVLLVVNDLRLLLLEGHLLAVH